MVEWREKNGSCYTFGEITSLAHLRLPYFPHQKEQKYMEVHFKLTLSSSSEIKLSLYKKASLNLKIVTYFLLPVRLHLYT